MGVQINTAAVLSAADSIDATNKMIRDELSDMEATIRSLQKSWEGEASNSCANKLNYIKRSFFDDRFSVVDALASFMKNQVGEGYETTERDRVTAASAFK